MNQRKPFDLQVFLLLLVLLFLLANLFASFFVFHRFMNVPYVYGAKDLQVTFLTAPDCKDCFDLGPLRQYFSQNGVTDRQMNDVAYDSWRGWFLRWRYGIDKAPTAIAVGHVKDNPVLTDLLANIGEIRKGAFVITKVQPPYIETATQTERGHFDLITLTDKSCTDCYDPALHDQVLQRLAMTPTNRETVDISSDEGKKLIEQYTITAVPTILLRGDLAAYDNLKNIWGYVGTIEDDGTYVLRKGVQQMGTYKQIPEGTIIKSDPAQQSPDDTQTQPQPSN